MNKRLCGLVALAVLGGTSLTQAAFDENLSNYTLDTVYVNADRTKDQFGNTITEQSYYRTGGDVKVITREEIEKRHYRSLTDAIKRIPGVSFQGPGYRGGEYGAGEYRTKTSINGDQRVVVTVDGRRADNPASGMMGEKTGDNDGSLVDLDQVININSVEKIEVIKGPGASIYGADAVGGVINIITRKGSAENRGSIDVAVGSWGKRDVDLTLSGAQKRADGTVFRYFISADKEKQGNTRYHDNLTNKDYTYYGTAGDDKSLNIRLENEFNKKQSFRVRINHQQGHDDYPIAARDYRHWSQKKWEEIIYNTEKGKFGAKENPGYRNLFSLDAASGSYNSFKKNDVSLTYTFDKQGPMQSFVELFNSDDVYWGVDRYPDWLDYYWDQQRYYYVYREQPYYPKWGNSEHYVPWPGSEKFKEFLAQYKFRKTRPSIIYHERSRGARFEMGKTMGNHDVLVGFKYTSGTLGKEQYKSVNSDERVMTDVNRKHISAYIQDKIHMSDKWDITPAVRYIYSDAAYTIKDDYGRVTGRGTAVTSNVSGAVNTQYAIDDTFSVYGGVTQVARPLRPGDYPNKTITGEHLKDEKGMVYSVGLNKAFNNKNTKVGLNYVRTDMKNTIAYYSYFNPQIGYFESRGVNATQKKDSFNVTVAHKFGEYFTLGASYSYTKSDKRAKAGMEFDLLLGSKDKENVNKAINRYKPLNHYALNLSYERGKINTGFLVNYYSGMDADKYTKASFVVVDWNFNYQVNDALSAYVTVNNLTNAGWENIYNAYNGIGAYPQPGRHYMAGMKYNF